MKKILITGLLFFISYSTTFSFEQSFLHEEYKSGGINKDEIHDLYNSKVKLFFKKFGADNPEEVIKLLKIEELLSNAIQSGEVTDNTYNLALYIHRKLYYYRYENDIFISGEDTSLAVIKLGRDLITIDTKLWEYTTEEATQIPEAACMNHFGDNSFFLLKINQNGKIYDDPDNILLKYLEKGDTVKFFNGVSLSEAFNSGIPDNNGSINIITSTGEKIFITKDDLIEHFFDLFENKKNETEERIIKINDNYVTQEVPSENSKLLGIVDKNIFKKIILSEGIDFGINSWSGIEIESPIFILCKNDSQLFYNYHNYDNGKNKSIIYNLNGENIQEYNSNFSYRYGGPHITHFNTNKVLTNDSISRDGVWNTKVVEISLENWEEKTLYHIGNH